MDDSRVSDSDEPDPSRQLLLAATSAVRGWLWRCIDTAARAGGVAVEPDAEVEALINEVAAHLEERLDALLALDVEAQRSNPLSLFRDAVAGPTALLQARGVRPAVRDQFATAAFPDDIYGITPATWSDIDASLQAPGIAWGAWKAMTVIRRHR